MIRSLFIANRGEIALRVIRTAKRLGIETILGVSETDRDSLPARRADRCVLLGAGPAAQSYLHIDRVVAAAKSAGADAVHPGYGFLAENADFGRALEAAGIIFVGPSTATLEAVGDKLKARAAALAADLPVVPGGAAADLAAARQQAQQTGYPLLIKAVSGGGGRGMKRVDRAVDLAPQIALAAAEAQAAFGDDRVYIERYIGRGRHVEVQVLGDGLDAIHLGDRDCSIQRRFQKLVEEAPAPDIPAERRAALHAAAVRLTRSLGYRGAGTVEFLLDADSYEFYFLEMNARIQVEHPVTEAITGIDIVEQQLNIADGQPLAIAQDELCFTGHALELRINAEDPEHDFMPSPGRVLQAQWPAGAGIRVDTHIETGGEVPPHYDSLLGKLIVHAGSRAAAIEIAARALHELRVGPVATTAALQASILRDPRFRAGAVDTRFFEDARRG